MKTLATITLLVLAIATYSQTLRIVDNNANAPTGVYTTISAAVADAVAGDTIFIQPSPATYGSVNVEKELHIVGIGFSLTKDQPHQSTVTNITLRTNDDNTENGSGTTITGLTISAVYFARNFNGGPIFTMSNVQIFNNHISNITWTTSSSNTIPIDNLEIYDNRITSTIHFNREVTNTSIRNNLVLSSITFDSTNPQSFEISNNIIYGGIEKNSTTDKANVAIANNIFVGTKNSHFAFNSPMRDANISNNIFYGRTPSISAAGGSTSTNFQGNTFNNNMSHETGNDELPPSGGGSSNDGMNNQQGVSPDFVDVPVLNTWTSSRDFTLNGGSPAEGAGDDMTNVGISGGLYPSSESNVFLQTAPIPTIETLNTNTLINVGDDLDVRVKIKSNQ